MKGKLCGMEGVIFKRGGENKCKNGVKFSKVTQNIRRCVGVGVGE